MTIERAQRLLDDIGASYEQRERIAYFEWEEGDNICSAYSADGDHLADIGFRPWVPGTDTHDGLQIA